MKISFDLWIRLGPEQFSDQPGVETCPEMQSLVHFYFLREIPIGGKIFAWPLKMSKNDKKSNFLENDL